MSASSAYFIKILSLQMTAFEITFHSNIESRPNPRTPNMILPVFIRTKWESNEPSCHSCWWPV